MAIVTGLVAYITVRFRARPGDGEPHQEFGRPRLEIAWTLASLAVVTALFLLTIRTMRAADPPPGARSPDVVVIGHQWWWEVRYPASGAVTANEIHLPVGRPLAAAAASPPTSSTTSGCRGSAARWT